MLPQDLFVGWYALDDTCTLLLQVYDDADLPDEPDDLPVVRVYDGNDFMPDAQTTAEWADERAVQGTTPGSPPTIRADGHQFVTGQRVFVADVGGTTGVNGSWIVTVTDVNHFTLGGATGTGAWTSGGVCKSAGLYKAVIAVTAANQFEQGVTYHARAECSNQGAPQIKNFTFTVV